VDMKDITYTFLYGHDDGRESIASPERDLVHDTRSRKNLSYVTESLLSEWFLSGPY
jgi:hypothetical protein